MASADQYAEAFETESRNRYPEVDAIEDRCGFAIPRRKMEAAARILACPVKQNPPSWQHGRVVYSELSRYVISRPGQISVCVDVGTAKGYSALCMQWALIDAGAAGHVHSCDVIDPNARVSRNTVADCDGIKTLHEILAPWPEAKMISFHHSKGADFLRGFQGRVNFCFVDGKHSYEAVRDEARLLKERQMSGDITIFDDMQIPGVARAVSELDGYQVRVVSVKPERSYAIAERC